jgi:transcriptional regulator with XRE-family HTH domain
MPTALEMPATSPGGTSAVPEIGLAFKPVEHLQDGRQDGTVESKADRTERLRGSRIERELARIAMALGWQVREERRKRHLSLRSVAGLADVSLGTVHNVEAGRVCALETYLRLADALRLKAEFELADPRRRESLARRAVDPVHALMGEVEAAHLRSVGFDVGLDEPFQRFQFAGRADVVAWSVERRALLHIENKTHFPDLQDTFGAFNAKRSYLGAELAARAGVGRWRSETHVIAALWSAEVLHALRIHAASFASVCPDPAAAFDSWWSGASPATGRATSLVILDPGEPRRRDPRPWRPMAEAAQLRPRYRDYADAVELLGLGGR